MVESSSYSGPVPHPVIVEGYTPEQQAIIFAMAEREQAARHLRESRQLALEVRTLDLSRAELAVQADVMRLRDAQDTADRALASRGQVCATIISIVGVLVAVGIVALSPTAAGAGAAAIVGGGALSPMAAQLIKTLRAGPPGPTAKSNPD